MRICRFKRLKPPLPTHLSPSRFVIRRYSLGEFEFGLDACGVSELVFYNSESTTPVDMTFRRNFNYTRLAVDEDGKSTFDPRFDFSGETSGYMGGDVSQAYGLFGLGTLTFLPGFYETRIAYYSWRGAHGFHFAAIPGY
ncbi:hypothetical protein HanPSC8_Chr15g0656141 [Helianthus annuus]|nr:hypothetical protein HanPSC8_Chr15g0656141 [Helianthus annuus]